MIVLLPVNSVKSLKKAVVKKTNCYYSHSELSTK